jgi:hypothetical protein
MVRRKRPDRVERTSAFRLHPSLKAFGKSDLTPMARHDLGVTLFDTAEVYGPWTNFETTEARHHGGLFAGLRIAAAD